MECDQNYDPKIGIGGILSLGSGHDLVQAESLICESVAVKRLRDY